MKWTPEKTALLGTMLDGRVANLLGVDIKAVAMKRKRAGIKAYVPRGRPRRTMEPV